MSPKISKELANHRLEQAKEELATTRNSRRINTIS